MQHCSSESHRRDCRIVPGECTVCVHCCLSVYLCENLNSVSCFLLFVSCCFTDTARSYGPHTAFIISFFLLTLSLSVPSSPFTPSLSLSLPFSLLHAVLCSTLISTNWNWREQRQIKPELEKARERSMEWWSEADGGCLWEGWKGQQISGSHTEEKDDMNPAVLFSCCFSLTTTLSFPLCFSSFLAGEGKSA